MIARSLKIFIALQMAFTTAAHAEQGTVKRQPAQVQASQDILTGLQEDLIKKIGEAGNDIQFLDADKNPTTADRLLRNGADDFSIVTDNLRIRYKTSTVDSQEISFSMGAYKEDQPIASRNIKIDLNKSAEANLGLIQQTAKSFEASLAAKGITKTESKEKRKTASNGQRLVYLPLMIIMTFGLLAVSHRILAVVWDPEAPLNPYARVAITGTYIALVGSMAYFIEGAARPEELRRYLKRKRY